MNSIESSPSPRQAASFSRVALLPPACCVLGLRALAAFPAFSPRGAPVRPCQDVSASSPLADCSNRSRALSYAPNLSALDRIGLPSAELSPGTGRQKAKPGAAAPGRCGSNRAERRRCDRSPSPLGGLLSGSRSHLPSNHHLRRFSLQPVQFQHFHAKGLKPPVESTLPRNPGGGIRKTSPISPPIALRAGRAIMYSRAGYPTA